MKYLSGNEQKHENEKLEEKWIPELMGVKVRERGIHTLTQPLFMLGEN